MQYPKKFEVIIIGGGHAGSEAAMAAARLGVCTLLLTHNLDTLGQMSCNPAIGGIGKGHLVREIDALGGIMGVAADQSGIQFRTLNSSKGPAVRATRGQMDRVLYKKAIRERLEQQENLYLFQQGVDDLIIEQNQIKGVVTQMGLRFYADQVVLTVGTFLGGKIHIGDANYAGGRAGDPSATVLAKRLRERPFVVDRLKTGTPPRIDLKTIDLDLLQEQPGDIPPPCFSFMPTNIPRAQQIPCYITYTNSQTHEIIKKSLSRSPLFSGQIEGIGPRYCPSIEDKVVRFAQRDSHQIFIEPEGLNSTEVYPNGISTSLPFDVQYELVRSIKGFANAHIMRPGYAIEYDFFDPRELNPWLETKHIKGLYFAGQINGTTGYEEAASQGLIAGLNAARKSSGKGTWYPKREESYIGVMIDDLITLGTKEPYRMFTSRAEYRLLLREDNADLRLTPKAFELGLVDESRWKALNVKQEGIAKEQARLKQSWILPDSSIAMLLNKNLPDPLTHEYSLFSLLKRPEFNYHSLLKLTSLQCATVSDEVGQQVEIQAKYDGYLQRQLQEIKRLKAQETLVIPSDFNYNCISGLSNELKEKLNQIKPQTLGQAGRIPGITPAALSILLVFLKRHKSANNNLTKEVI